MSLHTSILVDDLESVVGDKRGQRGKRITLVNYDGYLKVCVEIAEQFKGQAAEVVIALCHGSERQGPLPAALCFRCHNKAGASFKDSVYAKGIADERSYKGQAVKLHSVIRNSKLAIMLNCAGDQLLQDYVSTARKGDTHPDLLIYNGRTISMYTVEIYMVLLVNILDSQMNFSGVQDDYNETPTPRAAGVVYNRVRAAIIMIFEIVKTFQNDHIGFWSFLQHVGCVTDNADEKDRQELPYPSVRLGDEPRFRVYGRVCAYKTRYMPDEALLNFKCIQLVCHVKGVVEPTVIDCTTVDDIKPKTSQNDKIYRFLKRYQQAKALSAARAAVRAVDGAALQCCLARLKRMATLRDEG